MTTFNWMSLNDGDVIAFDPLVDIFQFNDATISAADIGVNGDTETLPPLTFLSFGGKTVTLQVNPLMLTTTNVTFADGSRIFIGDNTTGTTADDMDNTLVGTAFDDQLIGLSGNDMLSGGDGNDVFTMFQGDTGLGNDSIDGGTGTDRVSFPGDSFLGVGVNVNFETGFATGGDGIPGTTTTLISIEQATGTAFADTLVGGSGNELFAGQAGNDSIVGGAGRDTLDYLDSPARVIVNMLGSGFIGVGGNTVVAGTALDGWGPAAGNTDIIIGMENVLGSDFNDFIFGSTNVANVLEGGAGNDTLDGGVGTDTAVYSGARAGYTVPGAVSGTVSGPDGTDTLSNIERFQFSDKGLAFDLGLNTAGGNTVRIIGAAFDAPTIQAHPDYVGIGLDLFDAGMSMQQVCALALGTSLYLSLAGSARNVDFVNTVYQNVVDAPPSQGERDFYVGLLVGSGGTMTQAELLVLAANADVNAVNINLVGLQQSGAEFI